MADHNPNSFKASDARQLADENQLKNKGRVVLEQMVNQIVSAASQGEYGLRIYFGKESNAVRDFCYRRLKMRGFSISHPIGVQAFDVYWDKVVV